MPKKLPKKTMSGHLRCKRARRRSWFAQVLRFACAAVDRGHGSFEYATEKQLSDAITIFKDAAQQAESLLTEKCGLGQEFNAVNVEDPQDGNEPGMTSVLYWVSMKNWIPIGMPGPSTRPSVRCGGQHGERMLGIRSLLAARTGGTLLTTTPTPTAPFAASRTKTPMSLQDWAWKADLAAKNIANMSVYDLDD